MRRVCDVQYVGSFQKLRGILIGHRLDGDIAIGEHRKTECGVEKILHGFPCWIFCANAQKIGRAYGGLYP